MNAERMRQIIAILRIRFSGNRSLLIAEEAENFDPAELLPLAKKHGVDWLVGTELLDLRELQPHISAKIRAWLRSASVDALQNCADLLRIDELCGQQKIGVIFFKGAALAVSISGNVASRRYGDIDLLVSSYADAVRVRQILLQAGYKDKEGLTAAFSELKSLYHIEFQMISPGGIGVDIHWKFFHDYYLRYPEMGTCGEIPGREAIAFVNICGRRVATPAPEDHLLVLCAHHTTHCWNELRLVCDIAGMVLAFKEIDYTRLFARARRMGASRMLATGLKLAQLAFLLDMPEAARQELQRDRLARQLANRLWQRLQCGGFQVSKSEIMILEIASRDNWKQRWQFLLGAISSPSDNDFRFIELSRKWQWLYYIFRPIRQVIQLLTAMRR